jgi:hypothetical protein
MCLFGSIIRDLLTSQGTAVSRPAGFGGFGGYIKRVCISLDRQPRIKMWCGWYLCNWKLFYGVLALGRDASNFFTEFCLTSQGITKIYILVGANQRCMSYFTDIKEKYVTKVVAYRMALTALMLSGLVGMASAATLNDTIGPILQGLAEIFVPLLAMILAAIPIIIALAVVGFILGILAAILGKLKF